jgi:hypothetical protein
MMQLLRGPRRLWEEAHLRLARCDFPWPYSGSHLTPETQREEMVSTISLVDTIALA